MNKINEAQILIMSDLYAKKIPQWSNFINLLDEVEPESAKQELASYINELEELGYISVEPGTYAKGGRKHPVYHNNVLTIWFDRLILLPAGKRAIDERLFDIIEDEK